MGHGLLDRSTATASLPPPPPFLPSELLHRRILFGGYLRAEEERAAGATCARARAQHLRRGRAATALARWYRYRRVLPLDGSPVTRRLLVRAYLVHYPPELLVRFPELLARKCAARLSADHAAALDALPPAHARTKRDVRAALGKLPSALVWYAGM